jgi:hypothetical protein
MTTSNTTTLTTLDIFSRNASSGKAASRRAAAETRNRTRDEIKRVVNAVDKVRKWYLFYGF